MCERTSESVQQNPSTIPEDLNKDLGWVLVFTDDVTGRARLRAEIQRYCYTKDFPPSLNGQLELNVRKGRSMIFEARKAD